MRASRPVSWLIWLIGKDAAWLLLAQIALALILIAVYLTRSYHSDDTIVQVMLRDFDWQQPTTFWLGPQTFYLKYPLYWAVDHFWPPTPLTLLLTTWIQLALGVLLAHWSLIKIARLLKLPRLVIHLGFIWALTASLSNYWWLSVPNHRNIEIGLAFAFVAWIVQLFVIPKTSIKWPTVSWWVLGMGLVVASDPLFLYFLIVPVMLFALYCWLVEYQPRRAAQVLAIGVIIGLISVAITKVMSLLGFTVVSTNNTLIQWTYLASTLDQTAQGLLKFYDAWPFGLALIQKLPLLHSSLNLAIVGLLLLLGPIVGLATTQDKMTRALLYWPPFMITIYILSGMAKDAGSIRYLILILFISPLLIAKSWTYISQPRLRVAATVLLSTAMVINGLAIIKNYNYTRSTLAAPTNQRILELIDKLEVINQQKGYTSGYANFWDAGIISYFSNDQVRLTAMACDGQYAHLQAWYSSQRRMDQNEGPQYILHSQSQMGQRCNQEGFTARFGPPVEIIKIDDEYTLYGYRQPLF